MIPVVKLLFEVYEVDPDKGPLKVRLTIDDGHPLEADWRFDSSKDRQLAQILRDLEIDKCNSWQDLEYLGGKLWAALAAPEFVDSLAAACSNRYRIRVEVSPKLGSYPWESIFAEDTGDFLVSRSRPPRYTLAQGLPKLPFPLPGKKLRPHELRMLVIAPGATRLDTGTELRHLRALHRDLRIQVVVIDTKVTLQDISDQVNKNDFHIIHYIGHGEVINDRVHLSLNSDVGEPVSTDANQLISNIVGPSLRLLVFNCCRGAGSPDRQRSLNGLGALAMRKGVPAVVSMRYEILDRSAILFSRAFYESLFGAAAGEVDLAMADAIGALSRDSGASIRTSATPLLHVAPGYEELFDCSQVPRKEPREDPMEPPPEPTGRGGGEPPVLVQSVKLPEPLREALRSSRCMLVLGPRVLRQDAARRPTTGLAPSIFELARELAHDDRWPYPELHELEQTGDDPALDWMNAPLLQRICERLAQQRDDFNARVGRTRMIEKLSRAYDGVTIPGAARTLLQGRSLGVFYTWFDGLFHQEVLKGRVRLSKALCSMDSAFRASSAVERPREHLVLLRGSLDIPQTLVVTESEHEELGGVLRGSPSALAAIASAESGYSVLVLGACPRDPVVRQLGRALFQNYDRIQEGRYFACPDVRSSEAAFWSTYELNWLGDDPIRTLEAVARELS